MLASLMNSAYMAVILLALKCKTHAQS